MVHVTGDVFGGTVVDDETGVSVRNAVWADRSVEAYQWKEKERKSEYYHRSVWQSTLIDDSTFKSVLMLPNGNPKSFLFPARRINHQSADGAVRLDRAVELSEEVWGKLPQTRRVTFDGRDGDVSIDSSPIRYNRLSREPLGQWLYFRYVPLQDTVGDHRVAYTVAPEQRVSVLALASGGRLVAVSTRAGADLAIVGAGRVDAERLLQMQESNDAMTAWWGRLFGWLLLFLAVLMLFDPVSQALDAIPIVNLFSSAFAAVTFLFAVAFASIVSLVVIALAWLTARPPVALALLGAAVCGGMSLHRSALARAGKHD